MHRFRPAAALLALAFAALPAAHAEGPRKIAFVDSGNTGRSLSAEAIADAAIRQQGLKIAVISRAVDLDPFDVRHADLMLTMTAKHRDKVLALFPEAQGKVFTLSEYATGHDAEIADAWGKPMAVYQTMFGQLDSLVPAALEKASAAK